MCALGALGYWDILTGGLPGKAAFRLTVPSMAGVPWGMLAAPRVPVASPLPKLGTQLLAVFGPAALAVYSTGHSLLASDSALVANGVLVRL